jgi:hypothetical protein
VLWRIRSQTHRIGDPLQKPRSARQLEVSPATWLQVLHSPDPPPNLPHEGSLVGGAVAYDGIMIGIRDCGEHNPTRRFAAEIADLWRHRRGLSRAEVTLPAASSGLLWTLFDEVESRLTGGFEHVRAGLKPRAGVSTFSTHFVLFARHIAACGRSR